MIINKSYLHTQHKGQQLWWLLPDLTLEWGSSGVCVCVWCRVGCLFCFYCHPYEHILKSELLHTLIWTTVIDIYSIHPLGCFSCLKYYGKKQNSVTKDIWLCTYVCICCVHCANDFDLLQHYYTCTWRGLINAQSLFLTEPRNPNNPRKIRIRWQTQKRTFIRMHLFMLQMRRNVTCTSIYSLMLPTLWGGDIQEGEYSDAQAFTMLSALVLAHVSLVVRGAAFFIFYYFHKFITFSFG